MATVRGDLQRAEKLHVVDPGKLIDNGSGSPPVDSETGLPTQLRAVVICKDPKFTVIPNCFSDAECDHLIKLVDGYWMPSLVGQAAYSSDKQSAKGELENQLAETRTSWSCMCRYAQTDIIERLEHRLSKISGLPVEQLERFNMVRYAPGEFFDEHHDGKFRPRTVFVYLNDLPEDAEEGDTYFPYLGLSFKPRRGTAVMWANVEEGQDIEDSRMLHAGRAPSKGVKYGVNCFFNAKGMRQTVPCPEESLPFESTPVMALAEFDEGDDTVDSQGEETPKLTLYSLGTDPSISAIPGFLTSVEAEHLASLVEEGNVAEGPFSRGTQTLRTLKAEETTIVDAIEKRLAGVVGLGIRYLANLRVVRAATEPGLCNRGCGPRSCYICLSQQDEVWFNNLNVRLKLRRGDLIFWHNVIWTAENTPLEDVRTVRVHLENQDGGRPALGVDAFFHDFAVRDQQRLRTFVDDATVAAADLQSIVG